MKSNPTREIEKLKRKIASLEAKAAKSAARKQKSDKRKVTALAKKLGYKSVEALFASLFGGKSAAGAALAAPKRKRAKLTDDNRKAIVADLKTKTFSAAQVAAKHGVSVPTVNLIKKAAGLTKSRKAGKKSAAPA